MGTVGQIYIPLQYSDRPPINDLDEIITTRYGKFHIVVKNCILIKEEFLSDGPDPVSTE